MLTVKGIYKNGKISLQNEIRTTKSINVIVTFLEDVEAAVSSKGLNLKKFSFNKSRELLKDYKGSLSDAVVEERNGSRGTPQIPKYQ